jgi:hypothetical protein
LVAVVSTDPPPPPPPEGAIDAAMAAHQSVAVVAVMATVAPDPATDEPAIVFAPLDPPGADTSSSSLVCPVPLRLEPEQNAARPRPPDGMVGEVTLSAVPLPVAEVYVGSLLSEPAMA